MEGVPCWGTDRKDVSSGLTKAATICHTDLIVKMQTIFSFAFGVKNAADTSITLGAPALA